MSSIFFADHDTHHFITDSKGDLYQVSKEIADKYATLYPKSVAVVQSVDKESNTIWFASPLPNEVKADGDSVR